jgi:hypothetical protein
MRMVILAALVSVVALEAPARAIDPKLVDKVDKAIGKGVAFLRGTQQENGSWAHPNKMGATALAGLALLECGVDRHDKAVAAAAKFTREAAPACDHTYSIATAILFLDRLGDPADDHLIEALGTRLLAGQNNYGGWSYTCPAVDKDEVRKLTTVVRETRELVASPKLPGELGRCAARNLARPIQAQLARINRDGIAQPGFGDNSNTQFATLALWAARRHDVPVESALARLDNRYRLTQNRDGGWGYRVKEISRDRRPGDKRPINILGESDASTPTMTCAGLLGLAAVHGGVVELSGTSLIDADPRLRAGLFALNKSVGEPGGGLPAGHDEKRLYYYLWSLERVCVTLDLETLDKKDWYAWGAKLLLDKQQDDGDWRGEFAQGEADTCFALLFLKRANLARDLTALIGGGVRKLRAGGVGSPALPLRPKDDVLLGKKLGGEPDWLARMLVGAEEPQRIDLLRQLEEGKGAEYTYALAAAIGRLEGGAKAQARKALARRLKRMDADTLREYLQDEEPEVRSAAAQAVALKPLKDCIPDLIPLLRDPDEAVVREARQALLKLSMQDLGPDTDAWQEWWKRHKKD